VDGQGRELRGPFDLFRHEVIMTMEPTAPEITTQTVDDLFLPLARASSGLAGG
jgi:hypothetical protein